MSEAYACNLTAEGLAERWQEDRPLRAAFLGFRERGERRAVLAFPGEVEDGVRDFVAKESQCCSFFAFDVRRDGEEVLLEVGAPAGAEEMLDGLVEAFVG